MNNVLKAKLIKRLQNALGSPGTSINAEGLKSILIDVRDLLERSTAMPIAAESRRHISN
jgi:hypothetical protein